MLVNKHGHVHVYIALLLKGKRIIQPIRIYVELYAAHEDESRKRRVKVQMIIIAILKTKVYFSSLFSTCKTERRTVAYVPERGL